MNPVVRRGATAALLAGAALMLSMQGPVLAQSYGYGATAAPPPAAAAAPGKPAPKPSIGVKIGKPLIDGQKAFNAKDLATALAKAQEADMIMPKTPFEEYNVAKLLGLIYVGMNQFDPAAAQFNRAIASGAMPTEDRESMWHTAMLLNFNAKDYKKAIEDATDLTVLGPLDDQGELVVLQAYYFGDDFAGASKYGTGLIAARKSVGKKPTKEFLETLINAQIKLNDQVGAHDTLEQLVLVDPSAENWGRVIDQAFAGNITDHQALNLYRLRLLTKSMAATDYLGMASADLKLGIPAEAQKVLNAGVMAGTLTAAQAKDLLTQANTLRPKDEASLPQLDKVAQAAKDGEADVKLGESYWAYGRKDEAETAIKRGIMKGGLKDLADAQMTLGIVLLDEGKKPEALQAFQQAGQTPNAATAARIWGLYAQT